MEKYCKENGFLCWMDTSAKDDTNVSDAVMKLVHEVVKNIKGMQSDNKNKKFLEEPEDASPIIKLTSFENISANGAQNNGKVNASGNNSKAVNVANSGLRPGTPNGNVKSNNGGDGCAC